MRARTFPAAALCGILIACGGGEGGSGTNTSPSPTVTSLTITPATDMLKLKASESFAATATMSNGTTNPVSASWRSDNTSVATIDSNGRATGVASGRATIIAEYQGMSSTRLLRVVPDYQGTWSGFLVGRSCSATGDWLTMDVCGAIRPGDQDTLSATLTQQGAAVTGTLDLGGLAGPITGTIADNGGLALTGMYSTSFEGIPFQLAVSDWQTMSTDNAHMTGRFVFTMRSPAVTGEVRVESDLSNVNKVSGSLRLTTPAATGTVAAALRRALRR